MRWEEIIMGTLALAWAVVLWLGRREILLLGSEGSRGWRNPCFLRVALYGALILLPAAGIWLIVARGIG
jgi:hypothetical protein